MKKIYLLIIFISIFIGCSKEKRSNSMDLSKLEKDVRKDHDDRAMFTFNQYEQLLETLSEDKFIVLPMQQFIDTINDDKVIIGMRHDIDCHPFKAIEMAELESKYNISSTYFVLATADYYGIYGKKEVYRYDCMDEIYKDLYNMGHEIGVHNDLLVIMIDKGLDPYKFNKEELLHYKELGITVTGTAAHGSGLASATVPNYYMFSDFAEETFIDYDGERYEVGEFSLNECGYSYESNFTNFTGYFSESGGEWHKSTDFLQILEMLKNSKTGARIQILTHPVYWE